MEEAAKHSSTKVSLKMFGFTMSLGETIKPFLFEVVKVSKLEKVSHEMLVLQAPSCSLLSLWLSYGSAVFMKGTASPVLFEIVKPSELEEVSHEMLVFKLPHVLS